MKTMRFTLTPIRSWTGRLFVFCSVGVQTPVLTSGRCPGTTAAQRTPSSRRRAPERGEGGAGASPPRGVIGGGAPRASLGEGVAHASPAPATLGGGASAGWGGARAWLARASPRGVLGAGPGLAPRGAAPPRRPRGSSRGRSPAAKPSRPYLGALAPDFGFAGSESE